MSWILFLTLAVVFLLAPGVVNGEEKIVIDWQQGPLLLELNARPGLQIQVANRTGLRQRLELVDKAPPDIFATPEARVTWALETFATPGS